MSQSPSIPPGPVEQSIRAKLTASFSPGLLEIRNDSHKHRHHTAMRTGDNAANGETHFFVRIAADAFRSKSPIERHRMVNGVLEEEFKNGLHSLSLKVERGLPKEKAN
ncbi:bola domain protein [Fistulina hepatica ATCC 64428]|uniref:Bola domain protein n=1 Tax=Fistulina hepatica ATCC 64428 TaxID=1128425 RepID=A0A0D7A0W3_9AGAR|nr:bola domain protein [Fistulina hepatica ATCC 64428]